uniref:Replication factor A C-terminal domain-containing protein n=1 Tax=Trypanosoma congolense (strain IL3000) TaxID=1068625 RepID=G0UKN8_TRYCI|nr:conserved hypothetical protein [Trypanosoma congolense IL3000]
MSLSLGFCESVLQKCGSSASSALTQLTQWASPAVQIIDIQRYPQKIPEDRNTTSCCFYLAVSDSISLLWVVVPPETEMEELISTFQIEIGFCIKLDAYMVATAKNGLNVVIPISITYSENSLPLVGNPVFDPLTFKLSNRALTRRCRTANGGAVLQVAQAAECTAVSIRRVVETGGKGLGDYSVHVRVAWKGKMRQLPPVGGTNRFLIDFVGVDAAGDAILIVMSGGPALEGIFQCGQCVVMRNPSLTLAGEGGEVESLKTHEWLSTVSSDGADMEDEIPIQPSFMFGVVSVRDVINSASVGDVVSVEGLTVSVSPTTIVNTRRGHVEKSLVVLRDSTSVSYYIDVTLWSEFSRIVQPIVGERWCFFRVVTRVFMDKLIISTKNMSAAFVMSPRPPQQADMVHQKVNESLNVPQSGDVAASCSTSSDVVQVVLDLDDASESLPVLAKIKRIRLPLSYHACALCGKRVGAGAARCAGCPEALVEERFLVFLEICDGLRVVSALGFADVGEALFGIDAATLFQRRREVPHFEHMIANKIIGIPLLFWLSTTGRDMARVIKCQYVDMAHCALTVASAVEQLLCEEDEK